MRFRRILLLGNDHTRQRAWGLKNGWYCDRSIFESPNHRSPNDIVYTVKWYNREHLLIQWVICQRGGCEWTWGNIAGAGYILPFLVRKYEFSCSPCGSGASRLRCDSPAALRAALSLFLVRNFPAALRVAPSLFLVRNFFGSAARGDGMLRWHRFQLLMP